KTQTTQYQRETNYKQMKEILWVGIGGSIGSILRYLTSVYVMKNFDTYFPVPTLLVNITGSLLIGIILGMMEKEQISHPGLKLFFITGFCGGFTTFSAFAAENLRLFANGNPLGAILYMALSLLLGLGAVAMGYYLMSAIK
ncbi:MAG: fluoride efflux transporter CrcB, partial [Bacteroidales bacterium]